MIQAWASAIMMIGLLEGGVMLDTAGDIIVARTLVPSAERPQGEVRIIRRGGRPVVQTLLSTKLLKRVTAAIVEKERRGWPEGAAGHEDSVRYLAALEDFQKMTLARRDAAATGADRRVQALIEFVDARDGPFVAIGEATIEGTARDMRLVGRKSPVILTLSAEYVLRNMKLIVADSFHLTVQQAAERIERAGAR